MILIHVQKARRHRIMNYEPEHQILSGLGMVGDDVDIRTEDHANQLIENEEIEQLNTEECKKITVILFVQISTLAPIRCRGYFVYTDRNNDYSGKSNC